MKKQVVGPGNFLNYPTDHILGFFDSSLALDNFLVTLKEMGVDMEGVEILEGADGLEAIDHDGTQHGLVGRSLRLFQRFFEVGEWDMIDRAQTELKLGHILVSTAANKEQKDSLADLMRKFGAHDIKYFNTWYVEHFNDSSVGTSP